MPESAPVLLMFQIAKVWIDQEPGIEAVEVVYSCRPLPSHHFASRGPGVRQPPGAALDGGESRSAMEVVPGSAPQLRRAILEIPRFLHPGDAYLLRYRFRSSSPHGEAVSPLFTEEIVSAEVEYVDAEGALAEVRVLWSVRGWSAPNWSRAVVDRRPEDTSGATDASPDGGPSPPARSPRRFVARVFGPRGASVEYVYQLHPRGEVTGDNALVAWDNADEHDYHLTLP